MSKLTVQQKIEVVIKEIEESTNYTILSEMKAALNSVYGEERNQIVKPSYETVVSMLKENELYDSLIKSLELFTPEQCCTILKNSHIHQLTYQILIHFPEVTIKNENQEHLIRNIYVRILLRPDGRIMSSITGMRTTLTEAEFVSCYVHSHLPRLDSHNIQFHTFCTGIGEINQVLAVLSSKYTPANFMMLLMHIKNYLEWESKEGHPYIFMENVFQRSSRLDQSNRLTDWLAGSAADNIVERMQQVLTVEEITNLFNFSVTERSITASPTLVMERWMGELVNNWDPLELFGTTLPYHHFQSLRDTEGKYFSVPEANRRLTYQRGPILKFKGRDIEFEIIERSQTTTHEIYANPKITEAVSKKFSSILSKTALTSPGIKSGSALIYNT